MVNRVVAVAIALTGLLLLARFRWSPELYVTAMLFLVSWGAARMAFEGYTRGRLGLSIGAFAALFAHPTLSYQVRSKV